MCLISCKPKKYFNLIHIFCKYGVDKEFFNLRKADIISFYFIKEKIEQ